MSPIIALLTDFGLQDPYVGQMKAAVLRELPECRILDLTHGVQPHNVLQAGFFLAASWRYLPRGTVCLAVVDPGVGSGRRILLLRKEEKYVLAPDNGLVSLLLEPDGPREIRDLAGEWLRGASATFHGRDVFVPAGLRLLQGEAPESLGQPLGEEDILRLPAAAPRWESGRLEACLLHIDRFGNCVLNLASSIWAALLGGSRITLLRPQHRPVHPVRAYADIPPGELGLLAGSQGYLELAVNQASCAEMLQAAIGQSCRLAVTPDPFPAT
jgi:hypothetical protein